MIRWWDILELLNHFSTSQLPEEFKDGYFVGPTVFRKANTEMDIYKQEIFGPVLTCIEVGTMEEAMALSNANEFGNGCAVFTQSGYVARKYVAEIEAGQVGFLCGTMPVPAHNQQ